jgi:hypothetical protein
VKCYNVQTFLNTGKGRFVGYSIDDGVTAGPMLSIDADNIMSALDDAYMVGNGLTGDAFGFTWPTNVRSLSVGDIVAIGNPSLSETEYWAVEPAGWKNIPQAYIIVSAILGSIVS